MNDRLWIDPQQDAVRGASDPERLRARLDAWFRAADRAERVASLALLRVFYVPGREFTAVYAATLQRGAATEEQILSGSIRYEGDAGKLVTKADRRVARGEFVVPALGAPIYSIPEWSLLLWTFPNDPKLRTLPAAAQREAADRALGQLGGPDGTPSANGNGTSRRGPGWEVAGFDRALVRYVPRRRCVFRFAVEWRPIPASPDPARSPVTQTVYAKVYESEAAARQAWHVQEHLSRLAAGDPRWLRVPRPLYLDAGRRALYQTALPGRHLVESAAALTAADVSRIARALALLHRSRLPLEPTQTLESELDKVREAAEALARIRPDLAPRLASLLGRLESRLPHLARLPLVPCHGTFKLNHLLADGERVGLVDFDSMVRGDPLYDVANFIADLHYLETHGALPGGRAARLGGAFYEAWCDQVPWGRRDPVLDWYVACLLLRKQALKPVKHLHPDAATKIDRVLGLAGARLEG